LNSSERVVLVTHVWESPARIVQDIKVRASVYSSPG
jgi:hypothetical protein